MGFGSFFAEDASGLNKSTCGTKNYRRYDKTSYKLNNAVRIVSFKLVLKIEADYSQKRAFI